MVSLEASYKSKVCVCVCVIPTRRGVLLALMARIGYIPHSAFRPCPVKYM